MPAAKLRIIRPCIKIHTDSTPKPLLNFPRLIFYMLFPFPNANAFELIPAIVTPKCRGKRIITPPLAGQVAFLPGSVHGYASSRIASLSGQALQIIKEHVSVGGLIADHRLQRGTRKYTNNRLWKCLQQQGIYGYDAPLCLKPSPFWFPACPVV